jgi:NAD(P)H-nitrite reductase large subunit
MKECKCSNNNQNNEKIVCRCEEVTEEEIREAVRGGCHDLDSVKRMTRAGMGMCQSKMCENVISRIIREETGKEAEDVVPFTVRPPLRPTRFEVLSDNGVRGWGEDDDDWITIQD